MKCKSKGHSKRCLCRKREELEVYFLPSHIPTLEFGGQYQAAFVLPFGKTRCPLYSPKLYLITRRKEFIPVQAMKIMDEVECRGKLVRNRGCGWR